ncbi:MAG TPA: NAD(P)H-hydrate dehydratase [Gaiellaceae bacterium]|jgi:NAD(P)H-hydrate epimerase|nr:NAD(P)H-hydrate dehydratase [Gaiellaceae bacterium]
MSASGAGLEALCTAEEMRAAEAAYAGRSIELMERAGRRVAEETLGRFPAARSVAVWCGTGANGGDGFVVARELARARRECVVRLLGAEEKVTGDAAVNLARAKRDGVAFVEEPGPADLVVDALFGTGFTGAPRREAARAIEEMNAAEVPIVSVDLPSGVDASTGTVAGPAVEAALTVTFHAPKVGHAVAPGRFHVGQLVVADIGLAHGPTRIRRATAEILDTVPRRGERDNKYSAGSVLVVGGSEGLTGAPSMASQAALRAGAGIVTACVPASLNVVLEQRLLEVMTRACPDEGGTMTPDAADTILAQAERAGAVALGPGLGRTDGTVALVERLLEQLEKPVVLDADGLWALAGHLEWVFARDAPTVLTPHAGELARLLGRPSTWVSANRLTAAETGADDVGAVLLLKGADTLVARPGRGPIVVDLGNPGLATAGSGDVLTGVVAAFLAKGMEADVAAAAASAACGVASGLAAERHGVAGMIASDVVEALSPALSR